MWFTKKIMGLEVARCGIYSVGQEMARGTHFLNRALTYNYKHSYLWGLARTLVRNPLDRKTAHGKAIAQIKYIIQYHTYSQHNYVTWFKSCKTFLSSLLVS